MSLEFNTYLAHYGVKGQKWGVRRFQNEDGTLKIAGRLRSKNKPESKTWKAKDAGNLSDDELRRRLTRLQQEKQYKEMTASRATRARKWVARTAGKILVATAVGVLAKSATNAYTNAAQEFGMLPAKAAVPVPDKKV